MLLRQLQVILRKNCHEQYSDNPCKRWIKRIKNKNIKIFNHKPIIQHTIEILKKTNLFDLIVVSSDSKKIEKLCQKIGIDFFIKRQKNYQVISYQHILLF